MQRNDDQKIARNVSRTICDFWSKNHYTDVLPSRQHDIVDFLSHWLSLIDYHVHREVILLRHWQSWFNNPQITANLFDKPCFLVSFDRKSETSNAKATTPEQVDLFGRVFSRKEVSLFSGTDNHGHFRTFIDNNTLLDDSSIYHYPSFPEPLSQLTVLALYAES